MLPSHIANPDKELLLSQIIPAPGEMADLIRSYDWSNSKLGEIKTWPQSLLTAVNFLLSSKFPIVLYWGADLIEIYNDGYVPLLGANHPQALGRPIREIWLEIWEVIQPMLHNVMTHGIATWSRDQLMLMTRNNYLEECYFTWSYSPVRLEDGRVGGTMTPVIETTQLVLSARRFETIKTLSSKIVNLKNVEQVAKLAIVILKENSADVPFALIYLLNSGLNKLGLSATSCATLNLQQAPLEISLDEELTTAWPIAEVLRHKELIIVDNLVEKFGVFPGGLWPESPDKAVIIPLFLNDTEKPYGIFIMGINPRRAFDEDYKNFVHLLSTQLSSAISMAKSYQEEYQRAEALSELNRAKTTFFSNISHEFRTPLTLMLGPLEDSLTDNLHPLNIAQKERQLLIYRNTNRLLKLVNSLLDVSRLEENRMQAIYEASDIAKLTTNLSSVFRSTIEKAGLEFIVDVMAIEELVYLDQEMFEKIIFNLLSNAFKFTLEGKIVLSVRQERDNIVLKVEDTGVGIPENELPKMFERFHRIEQTRGRSYEGSGIGLALVQELVRLHQGSIQVTSTLGSGSTFTITLPLGKEHLPQEQIGKRETYEMGRIGAYFIEEASNWHQQEVASEYTNSAIIPPIEKAAAVSPSTPSATILVVDDNYDMCQYLTRLLRQYWQVEIVHDGKAALELLEHRLPDLILSDVMMPRLNGIELLQAIRSNPVTRLIPFILLSARAGEEARLEGLQIGADDYLVKPFSAKELLIRINTHLELGSLRRGLEQKVAELKKAYKLLQAETQKKLDIEKELNLHTLNRAIEAEESQVKSAEFVDIICHEVRTPLNMIYGGITSLQEELNFLTTLYDKIKDTSLFLAQVREFKESINTAHKYLKSLTAAARQQKELLDDMLNLSKLESGMLDINLKPFELKEMLLNIKEMFKLQFKQKNIKCILNMPIKSTIWLKGDEQSLKRILINLISNALKFTDKGSITINASIELLSERDVILNFVVQDTGIGMNSLDIEKLFNKFVQVGKHKSSLNSGTGLGLAISKKLVELMGGNIKVKSQEGIGSKFIFSVKCIYLNKLEKQINITKGKEKDQTDFNIHSYSELKGKKILIVDDNAMNQKILSSYVKKKNCSYELANDGIEALEQYYKTHFDLIFMDIEMPNLNGLEATRKIRAQEENTGFHIPIIGLSAYINQEIQNKALECGMDAYLSKPCSQDIIYAAISKYSSNNQNPSQSPLLNHQFSYYKTANKPQEINIKKIIKNFRINAKSLLEENYPFIVVADDNQFTIALDLESINVSPHINEIILNDLKKHLEKSLEPMVGLSIELDAYLKLNIKVASSKQRTAIITLLRETDLLKTPQQPVNNNWQCIII